MILRRPSFVRRSFWSTTTSRGASSGASGEAEAASAAAKPVAAAGGRAAAAVAAAAAAAEAASSEARAGDSSSVEAPLERSPYMLRSMACRSCAGSGVPSSASSSFIVARVPSIEHARSVYLPSRVRVRGG